MPPDPLAIARPSHARSVAVVDIGSNSIRLVIFDRLETALVPLFNERVFCALGEGLRSGRSLESSAIRDAARTVDRFARLTRSLGTGDTEFVATAAVRDADNGAELVEAVRAACGAEVRVLGGAEEARLSALGVAAGLPGATGIMGDLGGGSLELVEMERGTVERLRAALGAVNWLVERRRPYFFPVGGTWRALARLHIERTDHPLHIMHAYALQARRAARFAGSVRRLSPAALHATPGINRRRARHLPYAATLLEEIIGAIKPRGVRFCSTGLREGIVYERLNKAERSEDSLLRAAEALGHRAARFPEFAETLFEWISPVAGKGRWRRLALVACHLSDIAWREHPDYRAEQGLLRVVRQNYLAADHRERAFLGLAVFARYGGDPAVSQAARRMWPLLGEGGKRRAEALGRAMRLAYRLSAGSAELLDRARLKYRPSSLVLDLDGAVTLPVGEAVEQDLNALARALGTPRHTIRSRP